MINPNKETSQQYHERMMRLQGNANILSEQDAIGRQLTAGSAICGLDPKVFVKKSNLRVLKDKLKVARQRYNR